MSNLMLPGQLPEVARRRLNAIISDLQSVASPEMFGAAGDGVEDDAGALQRALNSSATVRLSPGARYKIGTTITLPSGTPSIMGNGATIEPAFGSAYGTALFSNDKNTDASTTMRLSDLIVRGNCAFLDARFTADNPGAGLRATIERVYFNTMDGNRRAGTSFIVADQIDFLSLSELTIFNCDLAFLLGSAPPRRNCTQLYLNQIMVGQVNSAAYLRGCDKVLLQNVDVSRCNSGFSFEGENQRIGMVDCHVEGIAISGYASPSARVSSNANGYGYFFYDARQHSGISLTRCTTIDIESGGTANGGVYVGDCQFPRLESITFDDCTLSTTMAGSASYKPIVNRGKINWRGYWPFTTENSLYANGFHYQDIVIEDRVNETPQSANYLPGTMVTSLLNSPSGGAAPTITEVGDAFSTHFGHTVSFNSIYELVSIVNMPVGWSTLVVSGYKISGAPLLYAQKNGGASGTDFSDLFRVQFNGLNDEERTWHIPIYNATPGLGVKVGFTNQNATAGADKFYLSHISMCRGFAKDPPRNNTSDIVKALPTASRYWLGRTLILRSSGVADTVHCCTLDASSAYVWTALG